MSKTTHRQGAPRKPRVVIPVADRRNDRRSGLNVAYIVISSLVVCSMLAVGLSQIDFSSLIGRDEPDPWDPNANVVSTQEALVEDNPDDVQALVQLGSFYANSDRPDDAIRTFDKAVDLAPDDPTVRYEYARALQSHGYDADAETQFLKLLELDPDNQNGHYYLAELYMDASPQRTDEARQHYEECVRINPSSFRGEMAQSMLDTWGQTSPVASPGAGE